MILGYEAGEVVNVGGRTFSQPVPCAKLTITVRRDRKGIQCLPCGDLIELPTVVSLEVYCDGTIARPPIPFPPEAPPVPPPPDDDGDTSSDPPGDLPPTEPAPPINPPPASVPGDPVDPTVVPPDLIRVWVTIFGWPDYSPQGTSTVTYQVGVIGGDMYVGDYDDLYDFCLKYGYTVLPYQTSLLSWLGGAARSETAWSYGKNGQVYFSWRLVKVKPGALIFVPGQAGTTPYGGNPGDGAISIPGVTEGTPPLISTPVEPLPPPPPVIPPWEPPIITGGGYGSIPLAGTPSDPLPLPPVEDGDDDVDLAPDPLTPPPSIPPYWDPTIPY